MSFESGVEAPNRRGRMAESATWTLIAVGRAGQVCVEVLDGADGYDLSVDAPGWAFDFRLPDGGVAVMAAFLHAHAGRAEFAECVAGSFLGHPVRLVQDDEFAHRLWLRVGSGGQLAEFALVGEAAGWFAAAVTEVAGGAEP